MQIVPVYSISSLFSHFHATIWQWKAEKSLRQHFTRARGFTIYLYFITSISSYLCLCIRYKSYRFKSNYNTSWQAFNERFVFERLTVSAVIFLPNQSQGCQSALSLLLKLSAVPPDTFYIVSWFCRKWYYDNPFDLISLDSFRFLMTSFHLPDTHPDLCNGQHDLFRSLSVSPLNLLFHQFIVQPVIRYRSIYLTIVIQQSFDLSTCINIQNTMEFPVLPVDIITYIVS